MGFYLREYVPGDGLKMEPRKSHLDRPECQDSEGLHKFLESIKTRARIFVVEDVERGIAAIVPVYPLWKGVVEVSLYSSNLVERHARDTLRIGFMLLSYIEERFKLHRIQATVKAGDAMAFKYNKRLGFKLEGYMQKYNPWGDDYLLLSRISEVK